MKKAVLVLLLCCLFPIAVFADSQRYYPVSSFEWQAVNKLCHYAGVVGPSSNGPVSATQLELALSRAEVGISSDNELLISVKERLSKGCLVYSDDFGSVGLSGALYPEAYLQTNSPFGEDDGLKPAFAVDQDWFVRNQKERTGASILLENYLGDFFYGRMMLTYKQRSDSWERSSSFWNEPFHFSLFGAPLLQNFPIDAGISLGVGGFSFILGRGAVSLGEGYTGNTAIGDNYEYQEFMKLGFFTRRTSVFLTLTNFDSSHGVSINKPWKLNATGFSDYRELRQSVTYEVVPFDSMKASLSFITLIDTNTAFDFRYLNPFMVMHNYFNYHEETTLEANNMISVDVSWSFLKKWSLYMQVTMDQFQIPGEAEGYMGFGYTEPNAFGGLLNVSFTDVVSEGLLNVYVEAVYNMPGMYLNSKFYDENGNVTQYKYKDHVSGDMNRRCWSQDYLLGYSRTESNYPDMGYAGYKYGPDCFVISAGGSYNRFDKYSVSSKAIYMVHGEKGRGDNESNYTFDGIDGILDVNRMSLTGVLEHTFCVSFEGSYRLLPWFSVCGGAAYSHRWNYRNESGRMFGNLQAYVGFSIGDSDL